MLDPGIINMNPYYKKSQKEQVMIHSRLYDNREIFYEIPES